MQPESIWIFSIIEVLIDSSRSFPRVVPSASTFGKHPGHRHVDVPRKADLPANTSTAACQYHFLPQLSGFFKILDVPSSCFRQPEKKQWLPSLGHPWGLPPSVRVPVSRLFDAEVSPRDVARVLQADSLREDMSTTTQATAAGSASSGEAHVEAQTPKDRKKAKRRWYPSLLALVAASDPSHSIRLLFGFWDPGFSVERARCAFPSRSTTFERITC